MSLRAPRYYFLQLQAVNYKAFYLAFLRVAIGAWLLKEICINWQSLDIMYGPSAFVVPKANFLNRLPGGFDWVHANYRWFLAVYVVVLLFFITGVGRWCTALLLFLMVHVLQNMNSAVINGGDMMARLLVFYLVFANSYQYFVISPSTPVTGDRQRFSNLLSNLAALCIMLQLCVAYFSSGIVKLGNVYWQQGEAVYYVLQIDRFMGTSLNKAMLQYPWIDTSATWFTLSFEVLFPILIWFKKLRKPLLVLGILFHAGIYIFMMIYGFQQVFVLIYGFFLPNDRLINIYNGFILRFKRMTRIGT